MKKGFSLIEILAVVTILGLLFILAMPKIINSIYNKKNEVNLINNNLIITAAKKYVSDNYLSFKKDKENIYCLPLETLVKKEYLSNTLDVVNDSDITNLKTVKITYDNTFQYEIVNKNDCNVNINTY